MWSTLPRLGLGCMRLSTDATRDEARGVTVIHAALDEGVRVFDTARSYALDESDAGHNERLLARALTADQRSALGASWSGLTLPSAPPPAASLRTDAEVVLIMGLQGSGKSTHVHDWVRRGYHRLNRDELGTTLKKVAERVNVLLGEGVTRLVLDNTYVTRTSRAEVLQVAARHSVPVRGLWLDAPLNEAQVNVVWRMLDAHGRLLEPDELKRSKDNTALGPMAQLRMMQELEPPTADEGFAHLEVLPFTRTARPSLTTRGRLVVASAIDQLEAEPRAPTLIFDWLPDGVSPALEARAHQLGATLAVCRHPAGPPTCWCRPPLPGLLLHFAHVHGVDLARSTLIGTSSAHEVMAGVVGAAFVRASTSRP